ncbi:MAG: peptidoglycan editing factor PgeF [Alphaproteobacteria bacterium]|nr:peptidoglycan editing factor PgeF [Alphaproteobacteria bacterium]
MRHVFTDRSGGVSTGPLATLNLARRDGEDDAALLENWARVARALDPVWSADQLVLLDQVHGGEVVHARGATGPLATLAAADAVVTDVPGLLLAIRTADCVPVLFAGPGVVGAAHAGWRGVAAGVVPNTVAALGDLGAAPDQLVAAIGPHIGVEAYEVGEEVVRGIEASGVPRERFVLLRARPHVDLRAAVVHQLERAGVRVVGHVHRCTHTDPDCFSHRRDGPITGRQASVIGRRG